MRRRAVAVCAGFLVLASNAWAGNVWPESGLYAARGLVSGSGAATRGDAVIACFRRVLVKVAGDPTLLEDERVSPFEPLAAGMVEDFAYQDRMSDIPHHDEQGTRDRPFDVAMSFAPAKVDAVLTLLGSLPYRGPRPKLVVRVMVEDRGARYPMTADAEADEQQREALLAAADRFAMRVVLPDSTAILPPAADAAVLSGTLVWDEAAFGWVGKWHFAWRGLRGGARDWGISGVSFDDALRDAVGGSLAALAGHTR